VSDDAWPYMEAILDCLTHAGVIEDDKQVEELRAGFIGKEE